MGLGVVGGEGRVFAIAWLRFRGGKGRLFVFVLVRMAVRFLVCLGRFLSDQVSGKFENLVVLGPCLPWRCCGANGALVEGREGRLFVLVA